MFNFKIILYEIQTYYFYFISILTTSMLYSQVAEGEKNCVNIKKILLLDGELGGLVAINFSQTSLINWARWTK